jgi:hypothetical protein
MGSMATIPLNDPIESWRLHEVRQLVDAFGRVVDVKVSGGPSRHSDVLFTVEDPSGAGPRAEVYLYEATGDADAVVFSVFLRAVVLRAVPRRVHLWGVDLQWADGVVDLLDTSVPGGAICRIEGPVLRPGIERLVQGGYHYRRRSNPFRREAGQPYGARG